VKPVPGAITGQPKRCMARAVMHTLAPVAGAIVLSITSGHTMAQARFTQEWDTALQARDVTAVQRLVRESTGRLPLDAQGFSPLHQAAALEAGRDAAPLFQALVDGGVDIHRAGRYGMTALHSAAAEGCVPCVHMLLRAGAAPDVRREDGGTPLHRSRPAVRSVLIAAGADVGARDRLGRTPLHTTADPGDELLAVGVNAVDQHGFTPLHLAALEGATSKIEWLLARGADPSARSTARFDYRAGVLAEAFDPVIPFEAGQRPYDLARWQYRQTRWATSRYTAAYELLDRVTPRRGLFSR
jgi:hypothetical protein